MGKIIISREALADLDVKLAALTHAEVDRRIKATMRSMMQRFANHMGELGDKFRQVAEALAEASAADRESELYGSCEFENLETQVDTDLDTVLESELAAHVDTDLE